MKLRERVNKGGSISWLVDYGLVDGVRKRVSFDDQEKAAAALTTARTAKTNLGALGLKASPTEMAEYLVLKARLPAGVSILEAVEYFMTHGLKVTKPVLMPQLVVDFIWSREELNRDRRTIQTYRSVMGSLARHFKLKHAHDVTADDVKAWKRSQGWSAGTQNKNVSHVRSLFRWAIKEKHAATNPCEMLETITDTAEEIEGLTVKQSEKLLLAALRAPRFMPYVCLGLFRGMRRAELERLRFEEMSLEGGTVIAAARKVKTRRRRVIELTEQAMAWIRAAGWKDDMMATGPVAPTNLNTVWPRFYRLAGIEIWPHNGLRHTFASMHYAMHQDEAALQAILGQQNQDVLHSNYRALRTKREAEAFFALRPPADWVSPMWTLRDPLFHGPHEVGRKGLGKSRVETLPVA